MESTNNEQQKLKLDQIMKVLFKLSKKVMVDLLNELFHENFPEDQTIIDYSNTEFVDDGLERIIGDLLNLY